MPPVVLLLCGPSFSGKSTLGAAIARNFDLPVISLDEINARRGLTSGFTIPAEEWGRTHEIARAELEGLLRDGARGAVVDDTNCFRYLRDEFRSIGDRFGAETFVIPLRLSEDELRARIRRSPAESAARGIDEERFSRHLEEFEWPSPDERVIETVNGARSLLKRVAQYLSPVTS